MGVYIYTDIPPVATQLEMDHEVEESNMVGLTRLAPGKLEFHGDVDVRFWAALVVVDIASRAVALHRIRTVGAVVVHRQETR